MAERKPAVYTIPAHRAFADALVAGLLARFGSTCDGQADGMSLARGAVLLPSNRAVRTVRDAFVRASGGGLLLPRLVAIGDVDLGEALGPALEPMGAGADIPPAIAPLDRQLILARLIMEEQGRLGQPIEAGEAFRLAGALGATLDQLIIERKSARDLADLDVGSELSGHWRRALALFNLLIDQWPAELGARGMIDLAERRNRQLDRVSAIWRETPPQHFVVGAGITTIAPAIAGLMRVVARMPGGMVVLPDLDKRLDNAAWTAIGGVGPRRLADGGMAPASPTHPQFALRVLLDRMGVHPDEVALWTWGSEHDAGPGRGRAISNAMLPPLLTGCWPGLKATQRSLTGVTAIEAANPAEEAQAIAIRLRETLEMPGKTAALVTPDRDLAARVSAHLRRWGVEADDSAGSPLSHLPPGTLLLGLAQAAAERFAPVSLLALLKHPLVEAGEGRLAWLEQVRLLDLLLRGPRPAAGLAAITARLENEDSRNRDRARRLLPWWKAVSARLEALEAMFSGPMALEKGLEIIVGTASELTGERVWTGHQGHAAARLMTDLTDGASFGPPLLDGPALVAILAAALGGVAVRPPQGGHPRIAILGLLEAQLAQADLIIAAGLNEGVWPALPTPDPWLAPSIRQALDLPGLDWRIGLAAHDFANALGAPEVLLSRARRDASAPTIASRFWLRLKAMTGDRWVEDEALLRLARAIDLPGKPAEPTLPPAPKPPSKARPRAIAVTDVDRLRADPYAFYASKILRLSRLEAVDAEPGPAWRGTQAHDVLERWMREGAPGADRLRALAQEMIAQAPAHPLLRALWQPRLLAGLNWVASEVAAMSDEGRTILLGEEWGQIERNGVTLMGKPDRIDRLADGSLAIVDYKSGSAPSVTQARAGYALQTGSAWIDSARRGA